MRPFAYVDPAELRARHKPPLAVEWSGPSREAAAKIQPITKKQQDFVWNVLAQSHGLTTEEICDVTGLAGSSVRPRLVELDEQGRAHRQTINGHPFHPITNPKCATRKNKGGREMTIWRATQ